jgi:hypothetical protein
MTVLVRFLILLFVISFTASAQDYEYRLDGTYSLNTSEINPPIVRFSLQWSEEAGVIEGVYTDNYFVSSADVDGSTLLQGKSFSVTFPIVTNGVKSIGIMAVGSDLGALPLTMTLRDTNGNPVSYHNVTAVLRPSEEVDDEGVEDCSVGFGVLTGYCGIYAGRINEIADDFARCRSIDSGYTRLVLDQTLDLELYLGYVDTLVGLPSHSIGSLPLSPITNDITVTSRNCGVLPGTTFPADSCQTLTLSGSFLEVVETKRFSGTYTITDEANNNSCTYNLTLDREVAF